MSISRWNLVVLAALVAIGAALLTVIASGTEVGWFSDTVDYLKLADSLRDVFARGDAGAWQSLATSRFPPGYPFVLMTLGAGMDMPARAFSATFVTAALAAAASWFFFRFVAYAQAASPGVELAEADRDATRDRRARAGLVASLLVIATWLSPTSLLTLLQPLSEPLMMALVVFALYAADRHRTQPSARWLLLAALAAGLAPFARSAALVLAAAFAVWAAHGGTFWRNERRVSPRLRIAALALALGPYVSWTLVRSSIGGGDPHWKMLDPATILGVFGGWGGLLVDQPMRVLAAFGAPIDPGQGALAAVAGIVLALLALVTGYRRLRAGHLDAAFMLLYAGVCVAWPFPAESARLTGVITPIVWLYAWAALGRSGRVGVAPSVRAAMITAALVIVPNAFLYAKSIERAVAPVDPELAAFRWNRAYYTAPDAAAALQSLEFSAYVIGTVKALGGAVPPDDCVYAQSVGLVELYARETRVRQLPMTVDLTRPLHETLPGCRYLFIVVADTPQHRFSVTDLLARASRDGEPVLASKMPMPDGREVPVTALVRLPAR